LLFMILKATRLTPLWVDEELSLPFAQLDPSFGFSFLVPVAYGSRLDLIIASQD
jgi:hypothetical protein